jgi:hypothetical protein
MNTKLFIMAVLALLVADAAHAQTEVAKKSGDGYFFAAPGVVTCCGGEGVVQVGGGGEAELYKGLGLNADLGYLFPMESVGAGIFTVSIGPSYQFNRTRKTVPFMTGGASLAFRSDFAGVYHVGGGVIRWFSPRCGLRFEVRDYIPTRNALNQLVVFRVGLALR